VELLCDGFQLLTHFRTVKWRRRQSVDDGSLHNRTARQKK
jgi:hypothetical protein